MNEREEVCKNNFLRVRDRLSDPVDGFDKQFFAIGLRELWSSFEAYLGWKFPASTVKDMRESFANNYQGLFKKWHVSDSFNKNLERLHHLCPVKDMQPANPGSPKTINDPGNLLEILDVSYRVRSNLDHGGKVLESETENGIRNRELVECSLRITYEILEKTLLIEKIIQS